MLWLLAVVCLAEICASEASHRTLHRNHKLRRPALLSSDDVLYDLARFPYEEPPRTPDNMTFMLRDPDARLNVTQIIKRWGYPVENHKIITRDGYILQIQRIPYGRAGPPSSVRGGRRRVAYLQHGLLSSSFDFVNNLPNESLGYIMADHGYDVWLGNVRGNTYGRQHVNMTPSENKFWKFTFDEFIAIDVPTIIDYILNKTGVKSLYYVGHSQGTTVMFGLLATQMSYQRKVAAFAALAPVANVSTITSPVRYLAPISHDLDKLVELLGSGELLGNSLFLRFLAKTMCAFSLTRKLCTDAIFIVCGLDTRQLNTTRIPVYVSHTPAGTSVRNVAHFAQEVLSRRFQMYDFGARGNTRRYGQATPPEYNTRNIRETPIALYWSQNDWLADPLDVLVLTERLPSIARIHRIQEDRFTHLDFLLGVRANQLVYKDVLEFLSRY